MLVTRGSREQAGTGRPAPLPGVYRLGVSDS